MLKKEKIIQTPEYWLESIQNELYNHVSAYMEKEGLNQSDLAKKLGVTKGYISQVLNGNFNFTLKKLIELSLSIGMIPNLQFKNIHIKNKKKNNKVAKVVRMRSSFSISSKNRKVA